MAGEFQKDVKFDDIEVGDLILVELFEGNHFYGDRRGIAKERIGDVWYFEGMYPVYKGALGYRMFKVTLLVAETTVPTAELDRLRGIEKRVRLLADAYASNTVMLAEIADAPDSLIGIMAECSSSASKMIRKALDE